MIDVFFGCQNPTCGAIYRASQEDSPIDQVGSFACKECGTEVYSWSGRYCFSDWVLVHSPRSGSVGKGSSLVARPLREIDGGSITRYSAGMPKDPFICEKFTKERSAARKFARNYFKRYPKDLYQTEIESWELLQSANIEFTMRRLREPQSSGVTR